MEKIEVKLKTQRKQQETTVEVIDSVFYERVLFYYQNFFSPPKKLQ